MILRNRPLPPSSREAQMLSWLASGEHEAVQVETLQFGSVQLFNLRPLLFPEENGGDPAEPPSPALL